MGMPNGGIRVRRTRKGNGIGKGWEGLRICKGKGKGKEKGEDEGNGEGGGEGVGVGKEEKGKGKGKGTGMGKGTGKGIRKRMQKVLLTFLKSMGPFVGFLTFCTVHIYNFTVTYPFLESGKHFLLLYGSL